MVLVNEGSHGGSENNYKPRKFFGVKVAEQLEQPEITMKQNKEGCCEKCGKQDYMKEHKFLSDMNKVDTCFHCGYLPDHPCHKKQESNSPIYSEEWRKVEEDTYRILQESEEWEKEFEKDFSVFIEKCHGGEHVKDIISFISTLLKAEREKEYKEGFEKGQKHAFGVDRKTVKEEGRTAAFDEIAGVVEEERANWAAGKETVDVLYDMVMKIKAKKGI